MAEDEVDNVVQLEEWRDAHVSGGDASLDDDTLIDRAGKQIAEWKTSGTPSLTAVQELFFESICAGASSMARDRIIEAILGAFGNELAGKRAMIGTWNKLARDFALERAAEARENTRLQAELTPEEKAALRASLWPTIAELALSPNLVDRMVRQVQSMGVIGERELIVLVYVGATSRVLKEPINVLIKGASSGGKSFSTLHTLELIGPDFVNHLTSSSALSLVYDTRPLAHTVVCIFEAGQLQAKKDDKDSTFSMLMRTLISEGRIVHLTSIEDPDSPTGRRVERIIRSGPISLVTTTTTDLYSENETRMLALRIHEDATQTAAVLSGIANTFAGADEAVTSTDLDVWHDLQRWIALGPTDVVIPFAPQIAAKTSSQMVRFRRDLRALFTFIQTSALLHQAQRQVDAKGRVIATLDDYRLAYPIFKAVMSESSGADVPPNVKSVVRLITERAGTTKAAEPTTTMRFTREVEPAGHTREVTISRDQIGTAIGTDKWVAGRAVLKAIDLGFLANAEIRLGKPYRLTVKRGLDEEVKSPIPDPETIDWEGDAE